MFAVLKIITLPALLVLPWVLIRVTDAEKLMHELFVSQPWAGLLTLAPGLFIAAGWLFRSSKR